MCSERLAEPSLDAMEKHFHFCSATEAKAPRSASTKAPHRPEKGARKTGD